MNPGDHRTGSGTRRTSQSGVEVKSDKKHLTANEEMSIANEQILNHKLMRTRRNENVGKCNGSED